MLYVRIRPIAWRQVSINNRRIVKFSFIYNGKLKISDFVDVNQSIVVLSLVEQELKKYIDDVDNRSDRSLIYEEILQAAHESNDEFICGITTPIVFFMFWNLSGDIMRSNIILLSRDSTLCCSLECDTQRGFPLWWWATRNRRGEIEPTVAFTISG